MNVPQLVQFQPSVCRGAAPQAPFAFEYGGAGADPRAVGAADSHASQQVAYAGLMSVHAAHCHVAEEDWAGGAAGGSALGDEEGGMGCLEFDFVASASLTMRETGRP